MDEVLEAPLVQFGVDDPTIITRWMPRVPRRIRKAMHQRAYHLTNATTIREKRRRAYRENRESEIARGKAYYEANRGRLQAAALARYRANLKASRAQLRARYAADPEKFKAAERERYRARKIATDFLVDVLARLEQRA